MEEGSEEDDEALDPDDLSYEELTALGEVVGTVATGLTAEQLAALPRCPYAAKAPSPGRPAACQEEEQ